MMRRRMLVVGVILFLIGSCVGPVTAHDDIRGLAQTAVNWSQKTDSSHDPNPRCFPGLQSYLLISWNGSGTQGPLDPGGEPRNITLTLRYTTVGGYPLIGKIILLYCLLTDQYVTVSLDIGDIPSWCSASLSESQLHFPISDMISSQVTTLTVAVDEHAPAYNLCPIPIHGSVETLRGPFGLLPLVDGFEITATLSVIPGYLPRINVTPESDVLHVALGNTSHLIINITNCGNAMTAVMAEIVDRPEGDWLISLPSQIILEVNMSGELCLSIVPPNDFSGTESITMTFTPFKADDYSQHGDPVSITIEIICEP